MNYFKLLRYTLALRFVGGNRPSLVVLSEPSDNRPAPGETPYTRLVKQHRAYLESQRQK